MYQLVLAVLIVIYASKAAVAFSPSQELCAQPFGEGTCGKLLQEDECNSWHGCTWRKNKPNIKCLYDASCKSGKPQQTTAPTLSPTINCRFPAAGCGSVDTTVCKSFNGCTVFSDQCVAGGCQPTPAPTTAPTVCIDVPPKTGCPGKHSLQACEQWTCCTWNFDKNICEFTPATAAPVATSRPTKPPAAPCSELGYNQCLGRGACKWTGNKCVKRG